MIIVGMLRTMTPRIELLWWVGCPSLERALADLRQALREAGVDPATIELREVTSDAQAERERFAGSPTILIDGQDPFPGDSCTGLSCRVYRTRDGRASPTPDPADLRAAIGRAMAA
jgi:hypothetical protein